MRRQFLCISPMTAMFSMVLCLICGMLLMTCSFKEKQPFSLQYANHRPNYSCIMPSKSNKYEFVLTHDKQLYCRYVKSSKYGEIDFPFDQEEPWTLYHSNWKKYIDQDLEEMRAFDPRAHFELHIDQRTSFDEFGALLDALRNQHVLRTKHLTIR